MRTQKRRSEGISDIISIIGVTGIGRAKRAAGSVAVLLVAGALASCAADVDKPVSAAPAPSPSGTSSVTTSGAVSDAEGSPDETNRPIAVDVATFAVAAYCSPEMTAIGWFNQLSPFLTDSGRVAYETVDPRKVPCSQVTAPGVITDGDDQFTYLIDVATNAGVYRAYVLRSTPGTPWLVDHLEPPT